MEDLTQFLYNTAREDQSLCYKPLLDISVRKYSLFYFIRKSWADIHSNVEGPQVFTELFNPSSTMLLMKGMMLSFVEKVGTRCVA